ncbi:uncharacterized protein LOC133689469 [Populus nigra]|uniref:uncharacterized protein LOC133689468 n=1 Tax=Populus nigra TaxID=3691 RepID=UPI002B26F9C8|nr:uncharacterized protein LOC133689468 [Populus nigra]XP_061965311.1 uncharacterized protein LOC133689469 [Populus nigra]
MGAGLHEEFNTLIPKKMNVVGWKYPPPDWMQLNVDGWICTSVLTELWTVITGLELAWYLGFHKIILESDFLVVVGMLLKQSMKADVNFALINRAREALSRDLVEQVQYSCREANVATD